jgi:vancomycin resistance protein VanJ
VSGIQLPVPELQIGQFSLLTLQADSNTNRWDTTYPILLDRIKNIDRPLLVVGDFNTSDLDRNHYLLNCSLTNAFQIAGGGLGMTFPMIAPPLAIPLVRIDHIFYSTHWHARSAWTRAGVGSNHQYLVADLQLK